MGQNKSSIINTPLYTKEDYEELAKVNDVRYGNMIPLIHKQSRQNFAVISKTLQDEAELT